MILAISSVPEVGGEAKIALECVRRLAPLLPGALGIIYDGAFRGVQLVELLRDRGLLPIVPVAAASGGRHARKPRTERTVLVGPGVIRHPDATSSDCVLYAEAGALCLGELTAEGDVTLIPLERTKVEPRRNADGTWRWYGLYTVPDHAGGGTVRVRLDTTDEDRRRKFNRAEHLRPIPPSDPEYRRLYARRADAGSINPRARRQQLAHPPTPSDATASSSTSSDTQSRSNHSPFTDTAPPKHRPANSPHKSHSNPRSAELLVPAHASRAATCRSQPRNTGKGVLR